MKGIDKMSRIVILVGSMRKGGNTDLLAQALKEGAEKNNEVEKSVRNCGRFCYMAQEQRIRTSAPDKPACISLRKHSLQPLGYSCSAYIIYHDGKEKER